MLDKEKRILIFKSNTLDGEVVIVIYNLWEHLYHGEGRGNELYATSCKKIPDPTYQYLLS